MKSALGNLKAIFADSPMICLSLAACCWSYVRAVLYQLKVNSLPLDIPLFTDLGMATEMNITITLTLVAMIGIIAGLKALHGDRDQGWYIGFVAVLLNAVAWWFALSRLEWGSVYYSAVD